MSKIAKAQKLQVKMNRLESLTKRKTELLKISGVIYINISGTDSSCCEVKTDLNTTASGELFQVILKCIDDEIEKITKYINETL